MYFRNVYFGGTYNGIVYLRRYLNEILRLKPPLSESNEFDGELSKAILQFINQYNVLYPNQRLPVTPIIKNELFEAIGIMLGEQRLHEDIEKLKIIEPIIVKQLQGLPLVVTPPYTTKMAACDKKLAEILGGQGVIAAGNGFEPKGILKGMFRGKGSSDEPLYVRMHLYGSDDGLKFTEVYSPEGAEYIGKNPYSDEDSYMFHYKKLGKVSNVTIVFSHIANFIKHKIGEKFSKRTKIGEIGGEGGKSGNNPPYTYVHAHISVQRGIGYTNKLVPFSEIFC